MALLSIDDLKECFYNFDYDKDGYLTIEEFRHIITNVGDPLPANDVRIFYIL